MTRKKAEKIYGITKHDAFALGICMRCKRFAWVTCDTERSRKLYAATALCKNCQNDILTR